MSIAAIFRSDALVKHIDARQRAHPPIYTSHAGWKALFDGALAFAPPSLRTRAARGLIAGGEIGELTPMASVTRIGRGHAIEMHSGMMRLIYSAARAFAATDSGTFRDEKTAALTGEGAAEKIARLFDTYREKGIATAEMFAATNFQKGWADNISTYAETFLLMHELAHVHNEHRHWLWPFGPTGDSFQRELEADATAARWLIAYVRNPLPGGPQRQKLYAGAEFGLRLRMAMETVGMKFEATHPTAGNRVATLRASLRAAVGPRTFFAIANTSLAFDQMWRAVERMLLKEPPMIELTLDDVLASMRTLVVELIRAGGINEAVKLKDVEGEPGRKQMVFAPTAPEQLAIVAEARKLAAGLDRSLHDLAYQHAGDVFEPGSMEFSLFLSLLGPSRS